MKHHLNQHEHHYCYQLLLLMGILVCSIAGYVYLSSFTDDRFILNPLNILNETKIIDPTSNESMNVFGEDKEYEDQELVQLMHWMKDIEHKLLYCFIPKNCVTLFKALFKAIIDKKSPSLYNDSIHHLIDNHLPKKGEIDKYKPDKKFVTDKLLHDKSWRSFIVLRDPLERLVSGFNDKCIDRVDGKEPLCEGLSEPPYIFKDFVNIVIEKIIAGNLSDINQHYRPQWTFCGLKDYFPKYFDFIIYYDKLTIADDTLQFVKNVGGIDIDKYYYSWGQYNNESMFVRKTWHASNVSQISFEDKVSFYKRFYDKELAMRVISAYHVDYLRLKFQYPAWLEALN